MPIETQPHLSAEVSSNKSNSPGDGADRKSAPIESIRLRGIHQNNLKGFDLDLPLGQLIVVTGLSGSGKSSLVFETLHAEGQRRYVETFSPYTRQFLELLNKPKVESIANIRPSIAIEQTNTVRTSRSTVGTMTELTDYFKAWFPNVAELIDPSTGQPIRDDNPQTIWKDARARLPERRVLVCFAVEKPSQVSWEEITKNLISQGFSRVILGGAIHRLASTTIDPSAENVSLLVVQDRLCIEARSRKRFLEAAGTALHFGQGTLYLYSDDGAHQLACYNEGLRSPVTGERYRPPTPGLFSFNSPLGACPKCRGFGRVIEIDPDLVIPDKRKTLRDGAIRAFEGKVYSNSQRDLERAARRLGIRLDIPVQELSEKELDLLWRGEPGYDERRWETMWYGLNGFFNWLESNTYKMHVRVFLSKFRAYVECPECCGTRLKQEALNWKWQGRTLPELYQMPVSELLNCICDFDTFSDSPGDRRDSASLAYRAIRTRLEFLEQVGLGYLTLDRTSRTLSGGETQRVSLTSCLGTALVDTLFVLDEPSIGLHARDINRLIGVLRRLVELGNTVVVVEHDESVMRAADTVIEIGPGAGSDGGQLNFVGRLDDISRCAESITGDYLTGRKTVPVPESRRAVTDDLPRLHLRGVAKHNLESLDVSIPLTRLVCFSGVSGSGKSTLLNHVIYQGLLRLHGRSADSPAKIEKIETEKAFSDLVLVDQSPVSRTPRSNPALFSDAWDAIRSLFADTDAAKSQGFTASTFSFNTGEGRCDQCNGLGYERVEMQFLSDVYVPCPVCDGARFKSEVLAVQWQGRSVAEVLDMDVKAALAFFHGQHKVTVRLQALADVGLDYLALGQPLNTLSGGESQRLKLVKYLSRFDVAADHALLLLDEPTTGLHRDDVKRLIAVLQALIDKGHSILVVEHQLDVLAAADWIVEMGPEAGARGGKVVFEGSPEALVAQESVTAPFLRELIEEGPMPQGHQDENDGSLTVTFQPGPAANREFLEAAQPPVSFEAEAESSSNPHITQLDGENGFSPATAKTLEILGAREHNLKNLNVSIPHRQITVVTGVSGSGKSSLAFDIIFAEGQRRFMESMSSYARQFIEQMPKPDIDALSGIAPTVAIEQRVTRGSRKSTVATITEVAQYLRLLYARVGVQHSPKTGKPVLPQAPSEIAERLEKVITANKWRKHLYLLAPAVRGRKGHHQPLANWAEDHGFPALRCDGSFVEIANFKKLDRYREHDIDIVVADLGAAGPHQDTTQARRELLDTALKLGKGSCLVMATDGQILGRFSTTRADPDTGEAYPALDPKHFSWNSPRGWCPICRGHGIIHEGLREEEDAPEVLDQVADGEPCPECQGTRLNPMSRAVRLYLKSGDSISLPELLQLPSDRLLKTLEELKLDKRGLAIASDIIPQIGERLEFMGRVGLGYLTLDRATATLSGGEAQRIRLAAQLGSNLSGVLYVLDEPSIGLHASDNSRLIDSLKSLRDQDNTVLVVEHDDDTMRAADHIIDVGPGAGKHGGEILAEGPPGDILDSEASLTGQYLKRGIPHPIRGKRRSLPKPFNPRGRPREPEWLALRGCSLRNLRGDDLELPLNRLIGICGVSGAGKSTLMRDLLKEVVDEAIRTRQRKLRGGKEAAFRDCYFADVFRRVVEVDQSPIGKTPRSTPATYVGAFDIIRELYASLPEAKMRGYTAGTFSFNTKGGRCETCKGAGRIKLEMNFMPDTFVDCEDCRGRRYGPELEDLRWKDKSIADVLEMTIEEAADFFDFHSHLQAVLKLLVETGLGYLQLGQTSPSLSGGEAQRLKLVSELAHGLPTWTDRTSGTQPRNLYLLEEPTIGLHLSDCARLIQLLHRLVDQGHTVCVIEHHLDILAEADYLVEIGPGGGQQGGRILFQGIPEELAAQGKNGGDSSTPTAPYLLAKLSP